MLVSACAVALAALLAGTCYVFFGSLSVPLLYMRGDRLIAMPTSVDLGLVEARTDHTVVFRMHNWTEGPVKLLGSNSGCACLTTADLPCTLLPGQSTALTINYRVPQTQQAIEQHIDFYSDYTPKRYIRFTIRGTVRGPAASR
jgi:hypothetical protein